MERLPEDVLDRVLMSYLDVPSIVALESTSQSFRLWLRSCVTNDNATSSKRIMAYIHDRHRSNLAFTKRAIAYLPHECIYSQTFNHAKILLYLQDKFLGSNFCRDHLSMESYMIDTLDSIVDNTNEEYHDDLPTSDHKSLWTQYRHEIDGRYNDVIDTLCRQHPSRKKEIIK